MIGQWVFSFSKWRAEIQIYLAKTQKSSFLCTLIDTTVLWFMTVLHSSVRMLAVHSPCDPSCSCEHSRLLCLRPWGLGISKNEQRGWWHLWEICLKLCPGSVGTHAECCQGSLGQEGLPPPREGLFLCCSPLFAALVNPLCPMDSSPAFCGPSVPATFLLPWTATRFLSQGSQLTSLTWSQSNCPCNWNLLLGFYRTMHCVCTCRGKDIKA